MAGAGANRENLIPPIPAPSQRKSQPEIIIVPDRATLAQEAATRVVSLARKASAARGRFTAALSGGSTPRELYQLLATPEFSSQIDWRRAHFFWGDERAVPPDHPDSNYRRAREVLLSRVPIPDLNIHRIRGERAAEDAAREYEDDLQTFFQPPHDSRKRGKVPRFDLILLGLGADAHTASLFPHTPVLREQSRWVASLRLEQLNANRITFTPPLINAAANILFLVAGIDKADAARAVLRGEHSPGEFPAQLIQPVDGSLTWLMDRQAAAKMESDE